MQLTDFFKEHKKIALAFSGGVDSAYLLYEAVASGVDVTAYYVRSQFQPAFEYEDAIRLAKSLNASMKVITIDVLADEKVRINPADRCYYCKQKIFTAILKEAVADGYQVLVDGTNASDDATDRPGMKALEELHVYSPLRICGLTKTQIREASREADLFTWNKPAYACLATRIRCGEVITDDTLVKIEKAEAYLHSLGFSDLRVRLSDGQAKIQLKETQFQAFFQKYLQIRDELKTMFSELVLDLTGR